MPPRGRRGRSRRSVAALADGSTGAAAGPPCSRRGGRRGSRNSPLSLLSMGPVLPDSGLSRAAAGRRSWVTAARPGATVSFGPRRYIVIRDHFCPLVPHLEAANNRARRLQHNRMRTASKIALSRGVYMDPVVGFPKEFVDMLKASPRAAIHGRRPPQRDSRRRSSLV
ncbi:hypothetical protein ACP4OV_029454 [Aristida adscensionis]